MGDWLLLLLQQERSSVGGPRRFGADNVSFAVSQRIVFVNFASALRKFYLFAVTVGNMPLYM